MPLQPLHHKPCLNLLLNRLNLSPGKTLNLKPEAAEAHTGLANDGGQLGADVGAERARDATSVGEGHRGTQYPANQAVLLSKADPPEGGSPSVQTFGPLVIDQPSTRNPARDHSLA